MARRKSKPRRRQNRSINLTNVAQGVVTANIMTQGLFNVNALEFLRGTPGTVMNAPPMSGTKPSYSTVYTGVAQGSNRISIGELLGGSNDFSKPVGTQIMENLQANGFNMAFQLVGTKVGFKLFKQFGRPVLTPARRLLKGSGVTV